MPVSRHGRKCHMPNGETEGTKPNPALALEAAPSVTSPRSGQEGLRRGSAHAGCRLDLARRAALARNAASRGDSAARLAAATAPTCSPAWEQR